MNRARKEMILNIWQQFEMAKSNMDREYVIRSQEIVAEWAEKNGVDLNEISDLEEIQDKLQKDENMTEKSQKLAEEMQARFQHMLFEQLIPAIDETKIACKDGIITPDDIRSENAGSSLILPG